MHFCTRKGKALSDQSEQKLKDGMYHDVRVGGSRDFYFKKFEINNFACSHVLFLGSLVSELFLFLLYDLSLPVGTFFWPQ